MYDKKERRKHIKGTQRQTTKHVKCDKKKRDNRYIEDDTSY